MESCTFFSCYTLEEVRIPSRLTKIRRDAFGDCKNFTVYAPKNSCAESYAEVWDITFREECFTE